MNLRYILFLAISAALLTACNFTLAADVTPPPNYVPPTPMPTLGPLFPAQAPDIANGKIIYTEKCAPCHGDTGLGDGTQGKQLPVTVAAFALPETARKVAPAQWFTTVTQGNLDRYMPPFVSLSDQERWDVISYALTLHTTSAQVDEGKALFDENCAGCANQFNNLEKMSALSDDDIVKMIKQGAERLPAFGSGYSDDQAYAVAGYIRTLSLAAPSAPLADTATETPSALETPAEGTQAEVTPGATAESSFSTSGNVNGAIDNRSGSQLPSDLKVTLHGYDHSTDPNAGPQEILTLDGNINPDGTYHFNTPLVENQLYLAEIDINGFKYQTKYTAAPTGATDLTLPDIVIYSTTDDINILSVKSVDIFFDLASDTTVQMFAVYTINNSSDKTVLVKVQNNQQVPFIAFPQGAQTLGYEATQDSAVFVPISDGFAMPPSDTSYGLIAFASMPKTREMQVSQPADLPIGKLTIYLPEGVSADGTSLTDQGVQALQSANFHVYSAGQVNQGQNVDFTLTGKPKNTAVAPNVTQNRSLLFGVGAFGLALIASGVWMYMRDRKKETEPDEDENESDDSDSIMDAIIALDDLHREGKLSDAGYKRRRNELKSKLKRKG